MRTKAKHYRRHLIPTAYISEIIEKNTINSPLNIPL